MPVLVLPRDGVCSGNGCHGVQLFLQAFINGLPGPDVWRCREGGGGDASNGDRRLILLLGP